MLTDAERMERLMNRLQRLQNRICVAPSQADAAEKRGDMATAEALRESVRWAQEKVRELSALYGVEPPMAQKAERRKAEQRHARRAFFRRQEDARKAHPPGSGLREYPEPVAAAPARPLPCPSGKRAYGSQPEARAALRELRAKREVEECAESAEARAYRCDDCGQYHLTSMRAHPVMSTRPPHPLPR